MLLFLIVQGRLILNNGGDPVNSNCVNKTWPLDIFSMNCCINVLNVSVILIK